MATPTGSNIDSTEDDNIKENNRKASTSSMVSPEIRLSMVIIICTKIHLMFKRVIRVVYNIIYFSFGTSFYSNPCMDSTYLCNYLAPSVKIKRCWMFWATVENLKHCSTYEIVGTQC